MGIRWLHDIGRQDSGTCGLKAANLGELIRLGLAVPSGFVVPVNYYRDHIARCELLDALGQHIESKDWAAVETTAAELIDDSGLSDELRNELSDAWTRLGGVAVAVRSSATAEDLEGASFAGQYCTQLNIGSGDELRSAVRKCWASLWGREVLEYRERLALDQLAGDMAVIVQVMVPADAAGVLFTTDPVSQRSDRMLVEVVTGLGEALVSGMSGGTVLRVERSTLDVVDRDGDDDKLPSHQLERLCRAALDIETHFGCPQDIEFAFRDGEPEMLQARPITTLGSASPETLPALGKPSLADKLMHPLVAERYPLAPRPLDNLIYTRLVGAAIAGLRRSGVIVRDEDEAAFRAETWRQAYRFPPHRYTWRLLGGTWQMFGLLRADWSNWWESGPGPTLRRETEPIDLAQLSNREIFARVERLLAVWEEPLNERMFAASAFRAESLLRLLITLAVGKHRTAGTLAALMSALKHPTIEANAALWALAHTARQSPAILAAIEALDPPQLQATPEGQAFSREFDRFLETFGHRETSCWYLSTPTWRRDPTQVWRLLCSMVKTDEATAKLAETQDHYLAVRQLVEQRLRLLPGFSGVFGRLLDALRGLTEFRELSHFDLTRVQAALQDIAAECGKRLADRRLLNSADDVFYLRYDEVRQWLDGDMVPSTDEALRLLAERRATYQVANARWQQERYSACKPRSRFTGIATSAGTTSGKARIVRSEQQFERLRPGEILVCPFTTPAWTPLFASAAAVVTETGGAASHAAIIAREYGIPAVMSVPGIMRALRDEDEIVVDGDSGTIALIGGKRAKN